MGSCGLPRRVRPDALAYPLYRWIFKRQKAKYGEEILRLSEQLLNGRDEDKQP